MDVQTAARPFHPARYDSRQIPMSHEPTRPTQPPVWQDEDGAPVSCTEKIKVLNDNWAELRQMIQDAFEDGILMGCSEEQLRLVFRELVDSLHNPYRKA